MNSQLILLLTYVSLCTTVNNSFKDVNSSSSSATTVTPITSISVTPATSKVVTPAKSKEVTPASLKKVTASTLSVVTNSTSNNNVTTTRPTTCGVNSSCHITTVATTLKPNVTVTKKPNKDTEKVQRKLDFERYDGKHACTCNLKRHYCDINCCCDRDCSINDKQIFTHCEEDENIYYDTRYCDYMKYIYINNTQFEWQVNQNGLFCVIRSNLPPSYTLQRKKPLKSVKDVELEKNSAHTWFNNKLNYEEKTFNSSKMFVYGQPIWSIDKNNNIKKIQLPNSFMTEACIINEDILVLKNVQNKCSQYEVSEKNIHLNLKTFFRNSSVISASHLFNISAYKKNPFQNCPKNVCLPIDSKICGSSFKNCFTPKNFSLFLNVKCHLNLMRNENVCNNVVTAIRYNIYHNGTQGLKKVEILATLKNVTYYFGDENFHVTQEFSANFLWLNERQNYSEMLSGNPGYIIGKPILIGKLVNTGNKTNANWTIQRNFQEYSANFMVLPDNIDDNCIVNDTNHLTIEFGYNLITKCKFSTSLKTKSVNATLVCRQFQRAVLNIWSIGENKSVGMFGNANAENRNEWTEVMFAKSAKILVNETYGRFTDKNRTLICFGIATKLSIDVFHARVDFENLLNQQKLLGVVYKFDEYRNISFICDINNSSTNMGVTLTSQVMYYDITSLKKRKFVDSPTFNIRLPYDFFYPFVKIENSGSIPNLCATLLVFVAISLIFLV